MDDKDPDYERHVMLLVLCCALLVVMVVGRVVFGLGLP